MDISIKDLIVKAERPTPGVRDFGYDAALAGATPASIAAFNELLSRIEPRGVESSSERLQSRERPRAEPRSAHAHAAARSDARTGNPPAARDATGTQTRESASPRPETTKNAHTNGIIAAPGTDSTTPAPHEPVALPGKALAAVAPPAPLVISDHPPVTATAPMAAANAPGRATTTVQPHISAPAAGLAETMTEPHPASAVRPVLYPELSAALTADADDVIGRMAGSLLSLAKTGGPGTAKPDMSVAGDAQSALSEAIARPSVAETVLRQVSVLTVDSLATPTTFRAPVAAGVVAAQDVAIANGVTSGATDATGATMPSPAQAAAASTGAAPHVMTQPQLPVLGLAAANVEAEAPTVLFRPAAPGTHALAAPGTASAPGGAHLPGTPQAAARAHVPMPVPLDDVAVHIARAAASGNDHISIKLRPATLGQVEVKLELGHDGRVTAVVTADRADTLDMLARDAKSLERALAEAGLKTDSGCLQFNLRGDGRTGHPSGGHGDGEDIMPKRAATPEADMTTRHPGGYLNLRAAGGGLDIRV